MGVTPGRWLARRDRWIAPAVLVLGALVLLAATLHPWAKRGAFEFGLLYTMWRYDQALPLAALGLVLAQVRIRMAVLGGVIFAVGLPLGGMLEKAVISATAADGDLFQYVLLFAPACSVVTGLTLVLPSAVRIILLPIAALLAGTVLGLEINLGDPSIAAWWFAGGAIVSAVWFILAPLLLWRAFAQNWFPIAGRIFGSWMIAIGAMLGALYVMPIPEEPEPSAEAPSVQGPPLTEEVPVLIRPPGQDPLGLPDQVY